MGRSKGFSIFIVDIYSSVPREHSYKNIALGLNLLLSPFSFQKTLARNVYIFRNVYLDRRLHRSFAFQLASNKNERENYSRERVTFIEMYLLRHVY